MEPGDIVEATMMLYKECWRREVAYECSRIGRRTGI
jgi:hypothetical protein